MDEWDILFLIPILALNGDVPPIGGFEWTALSPGPDSTVIYLSASMGDDGNDCLSEATACASLMRGESFLRDGEPDHLLLRRGDVWSESFSNGWSFGWTKSGRSANEPMVIGAYGDGPRPMLRAGEEHGFHRHRNDDIHDVAIVDLHFIAHTRDPSSPDYVGPAQREFQSGFRWTGGGNVERILIEGNLFEYFGTNLAMHPSGDSTPFRDVRIRGNVFYNAWTGDVNDYSQGMFVDGIHGLVIEGNVVDHNGGLLAYTNDPDTVVPAGLTKRDVAVTWFNHQAYIQSNNRDVIVRNNIFANGDGVQLRPGGLAEDNLFTRTINALSVGPATKPVPGGVTGIVRNNVFLAGTDFAPESNTPGKRANGVLVANINPASGLRIEGNLFVRDASEGHYGQAIGLNGADCGNGNAFPCPVSNVRIMGNILVDWRGGFRFSGMLGSELSDVTAEDNVLSNPGDDRASLVDFRSGFDTALFDFAGNRYERGGDAQWFRIDGSGYDHGGWVSASGETGSAAGAVSFADPSRSIETYNEGRGGAATHSDFMARARQQARGAWDPAYEARTVNAWLREGFTPTP